MPAVRTFDPVIPYEYSVYAATQSRGHVLREIYIEEVEVEPSLNNSGCHGYGIDNAVCKVAVCHV